MTAQDRPAGDSTLRMATITRNTKETQITLTLALDTLCPETAAQLPENRIETPLPFLNHMLNTFAVHGKFRLVIAAEGDIEVDPHHLVEDVGIVLGQTLVKALGDHFNGIERAGNFAFPMDGTLAIAAIDLCGRPNLVWNVELQGRPLGTLDPFLFKEFYKGFVDGSGATLHLNVPYADNDHHVIESTFKAWTRTLFQATRPTGQGAVMSTKGMLEVRS